MDKIIAPFIFSFYDTEMSKLACEKYGWDEKIALKKIIFSKTYQMLRDEELQMWDFSPLAIFDMWEAEQITGDPRNSAYIRGV